MKPTGHCGHPGLAGLALLPVLALLSACGGGGGQAPINSASALPPPPAPAPADPAPPMLDTPEYRRSNAAVTSGAISAWSLGWTGAGVTVGIVDSGIADSSPEFAGRISPASRDVTGQNRTITDPAGHGTAVAAVLAAARDNSQVVGIAPGVTLAVMRSDSPGTCGGTDGCRHSDNAIAAGINAAVAAGARAINLSLGGGSASQPLRTAIARATQAGVVLVISAGNDNASQVDGLARSFVAAGDPRLVIVAGGTNQTGTIASFSNRAGTVQDNFVTALAERVRAFNHEGQPLLYSGTSFATPQVTAAVALMAQAFPSLSGAQIVDLILSSAADAGAPGTDPIYGRGRLDLARAFAPRGATSLAGTTLAVSLDANGHLGGAMGSGAQFGAAIGQVPIQDGYGRSYQLAIGQTLRPAPSGRLVAALSGMALHRESLAASAGGFAIHFSFAAEGTPAGHAARMAAAESHLGFAHRGMDYHAARHNPVREASLSLRRGALTFAAATGPSAAAALPGSAPAGLVAPDGLEPGQDDARADRHLVMAEGRWGALRLAIAGMDGTASFPPAPGLASRANGNRARTSHRMVAAALPLGPSPVPITLSARWTRMHERGAFLGSRLSPAFGLDGATSDFAGAAIDIAPAPGWMLRAAATHGWHRPDTGGGLFTGTTGIASAGWSASLSGPATHGRWSLRLAQPLAMNAGAFLIGAERRLAPVTVDATERVAELGWTHGGLSLTAFHRQNPGHRRAPPDSGAAISIQRTF